MQSVGVQFDQPQASTDAPDWLSGLNIAGASAESETAPIAEAAPAPSTTESNDDWINTFTSSAPSAAVEETAAPAQDALPDWLGSSGVAATTPQAEAPAQTDWLNTLGATPEPQKQSGTGWLKEIEERKQREATAALTPDAAPSWMDQPAADATPSWLDQPAATPLAADATDATPSWLDQPITTSPTDATPSWMDQPAASASTDEIPDWLKNMPSSQIAPAPTSELPSTPTSAPIADDAQGWLNNAVITPAEPQPGAISELPDWLKGSSPEVQASDEVPAWLKSVTSSLKTETTPAPPPPATAQPAEEALPDFMKDMGWTLRDPSKPLDEPNVFADVPVTESKPDEATPAQLPDWLQRS